LETTFKRKRKAEIQTRKGKEEKRKGNGKKYLKRGGKSVGAHWDTSKKDQKKKEVGNPEERKGRRANQGNEGVLLKKYKT